MAEDPSRLARGLQYLRDLPAQIGQGAESYLAERGVDPAIAAANARFVRGSAERPADVADLLIPQSMTDVGLGLAAGPFGKGAKALAAGLMAIDPSDAEAGVVGKARKAFSIGTRKDPTPEDVQTIYDVVARDKHAPWPASDRPIFKTTPGAYAETMDLVPQRSVYANLPRPLPGDDLPMRGRASNILGSSEAIAARIAEDISPLVRRGDEVLNFYNTAPVIRGLMKHAGLSLDEAVQFMRDWAGQGAATSPRTSTPPNLRNSSYLQFNREAGTPFTTERHRTVGNRPGFGMMEMHTDLADEFARGAVNPWTNPKPFTFRENWSGNLSDVTADTHNIRATLYLYDQLYPGKLPREWFTSDAAYETYKSGKGFPDNVNLGTSKTGIRDTLAGVANAGDRRQIEYGVMADPWYGAAEMLGISPARAQAGGWFNYGGLTNLRSPPLTIPGLLNNQISKTAKALGVPEEKVIEWWARRKIPLASIAPAMQGASDDNAGIA